jgi:hypothetical protein
MNLKENLKISLLVSYVAATKYTEHTPILNGRSTVLPRLMRDDFFGETCLRGELEPGLSSSSSNTTV